MTIKAIETRYKGYRFRSRLEARWAVFFDSLGAKWEYEPEGFTLPNGERYLPDFRLHTPEGDPIWIEVKPTTPSEDEKAKLAHICRDILATWGIFLVGNPAESDDSLIFRWSADGHFENIRSIALTNSGFLQKDKNWRASGYLGIAAIFILTKRIFGKGASGGTILKGIHAARSARFEHGENGAG